MQIIPASLAIKAMRDSGYRDSAHALAELIDNSIQSGAKNVDVICLDKAGDNMQRSRTRVDRIAVVDNGCGMTAEVLEIALQFGNGTRLGSEEKGGIGKFGMGLPNSSISQCQKVEVWSWQEGRVLYSYLDVDEIMSGTLSEVPKATSAELPSDIVERLKSPIGKSGTIVLWTRLDRIRWKSSKALLQNSELLVGRMYRYFIASGAVSIRLAAFSKSPSGRWTADYDDFARPNDPLYLMANTSCPEMPDEFAGEGFFELFASPVIIKVNLQNDPRPHEVKITFSVVKQSIRKLLNKQFTSAGGSPAGKHAAKNIGISLVRSERELELNRAHVIGYNPTERFWGVEVSFDPALDEIFGVTNNKQSATAFFEMNEDDDAAEAGMSKQEYRSELEATIDPRLIMYEISNSIHRNLSAIRQQLSRMSEGQKARSLDSSVSDPAEEAATKATRQRINEGYDGNSDRAEADSNEVKIEAITEGLTELGRDPDEAREIAVLHVQQDIKFIFQQQPYQGPSFFSVSSKGGSIIVTVNKDHPVSTYLIGLLEESENALSDKALMALKLMLCSWARLEDETQNVILKQKYTDVRDTWGKVTRDFFNAAYGE